MNTTIKKKTIEVTGCKNESADRVPRKDTCWSDTNLDTNYDKWISSWDKTRKKQKWGDPITFDRLKCQECGSTNKFEVFVTGSYETSARCECGMYYIVHNG